MLDNSNSRRHRKHLPQTCQVLACSEWQPVRLTRGIALPTFLLRPQDPQSLVGVLGDPQPAPSAQAVALQVCHNASNDISGLAGDTVEDPKVTMAVRGQSPAKGQRLHSSSGGNLNLVLLLLYRWRVSARPGPRATWADILASVSRSAQPMSKGVTGLWRTPFLRPTKGMLPGPPRALPGGCGLQGQLDEGTGGGGWGGG